MRLASFPSIGLPFGRLPTIGKAAGFTPSGIVHNVDRLTFSGKTLQAIPAELQKPPTVTVHEGVHVVRDDLLPGGTKSRFFWQLFQDHQEIVYPSCTWGGAQVSLAYCAKLMDKKVTLFVPKRKALHPRTLNAIEIAGGNPKGFKPGPDGQLIMDSRHIKVIQVPHGYLNVLQSHAKKYCEENNKAHYLEVGGKSDLALQQISQSAHQVEKQYGPFDEVWCSAGSGTLAKALQQGFQSPKTRFRVVQVGMDIKDPGKAKVFKYPKGLDKAIKSAAPFPSCPHYDAKAWEVCQKNKGSGKILFWNVMGPPKQ